MNALEIIDPMARSRIGKQLRAKGREFAEALFAEAEEDRIMMAESLVLDVCDPHDWVESPSDDDGDIEVNVKAQKVRDIHDAMVEIVLDAARKEL